MTRRAADTVLDDQRARRRGPPAHVLVVLTTAFEGLTRRGLLATDDPVEAAGHFAHLVIGGLLDRLEASGYLVRRPDYSDRRVNRVFITEAGYDILRAMSKVGDRLNEMITAGIDPTDLRSTEEFRCKVRHAVSTSAERRRHQRDEFVVAKKR